MGRYHFPDTILALPFKKGIPHLLLRQASGMVFLPDQNSLFVTQIQEPFIVGVMAGADGIGSQIRQQVQIIIYGGVRDGASEQPVILMAAEAFDIKRSSIQQDLVFLYFHGSKTRPFHTVVHSLSIPVQNRPNRCKAGILRAPGFCPEEICLQAHHPAFSGRNRQIRYGKTSVTKADFQFPAEGAGCRIPQGSLYPGLPALRLPYGGNMHPFHKAVRHRFQQYRPGDP